MTTDEDGKADWRLSLAKAAFNGACDLIDREDRTAADDREMLVRTAAAHYLWEPIGGDEQKVVADWQVAHVLSWLGCGDLALRFAEAALQRAEENNWSDWRLASCFEGMARAHAILGNSHERDRYAEKCRAVLTTLKDEEDREIVAGQLSTVPGIG
jgi:hypothetical protein